MKKRVWGHDELMYDLADHLSQTPDRMIWTDIQMGSMHSKRPDVFTMQKSYSNPRPTTYEIKVSIQDFRSDTTSGKWMNYLDFSGGVVFAVPKGMVTKDDIPKGAGLIVRSENGWRMSKKPTIHKVELSWEVMQKLLIDGVHRVRENNKLDYHRQKTHYQEWSQQFGEDINRYLKDISMAEYDLKLLKDKHDRADKTQKNAMEKRKEQFELEMKSIKVLENSLWELLIGCLGLEAGSSEWDVRNKIKQIQNEYGANVAVQNSIRSLEASQQTIERQINTLKQHLPESPS